MAGQIEEPISFDFQADSVHSGSISFGRFAHEPLLWERRSSFSHNRIEEEVARCSKHRIVTEKKAYFEAHFKKKALLRQCSLDAQTGIQFETSEMENPAMRSHKEDNEFLHGNKNDASCDTSDIGYSEDYDNVQEAQVSVHFDESSDSSNEFEERGKMEYHIEGREILISEPLKLPSYDSVEAKAKVDALTVDTQTVIDCTYSRCSSAEHDVEVEQNITAYTFYVDEECRPIGLGAGSGNAEKEPDAVSHHRDVCPKIMVATEPSGTESNVKVTHTQRQSSCGTAKMSSRNLIRMGKQTAIETKTFKQSKIIPSIANKLVRSPNPEHLLTKSTSSVSKTLSGHNSAYKETRVMKVTDSPVTTMMKDAPHAHQNPNRTQKVIAPKSSGLKTCPTSFRFRSDVRAEKMKESTHIQTIKINRSHARTQEKTPDEIKQSGKGLNIKAKPMQSLQNKDGRLESKSKDAIANRPQMNPSHPRTKVVARPSTNIKSENGPSNSTSQVSTVTSYTGKKPTKTSVVSSLVTKSTLPSSMRNAVSNKGMAANDRAAKLKNQTMPPIAQATERRGTIGISQSISERTKKCTTTRKVIEKARPQEMCRTTAKVC